MTQSGSSRAVWLGKVPVYHLACDISEDAVKTLEQELGSGFVRMKKQHAAVTAQKRDAENGETSMRLVDTRAYVGMLKELVEQGQRSADGDFREQHGAVSDSWTRQYFLPSAGAGAAKGRYRIL